MSNYSFNASEILYQSPRDIKKYLTRSDLGLIIALEPHTLDTMSHLEILLANFEAAEEYEYCVVIKREVDFRVKTYKEANGKEED